MPFDRSGSHFRLPQPYREVYRLLEMHSMEEITEFEARMKRQHGMNIQEMTDLSAEEIVARIKARGHFVPN